MVHGLQRRFQITESLCGPSEKAQGFLKVCVFPLTSVAICNSKTEDHTRVLMFFEFIKRVEEK